MAFLSGHDLISQEPRGQESPLIMIIIILMITCVPLRNMLALIIMIVSMITCAEVREYKIQIQLV